MAPLSPEAAEIVRRKKQQYGRFVDTKQWSKLREIVMLPETKLSFFHPDGSPLRVGKTTLIFNSFEEYITNISKSINSQTSIHLIARGELEQTGPDEIKAIFAMTDVNMLNGTLGLIQSQGGGHYHEVWKRKGDDWFMAELRLERCFVSSTFLFSIILWLVNAFAAIGIDIAPSRI